MTEIINMNKDMVKDYPTDGGVYLSFIFLQGDKWEDSNPDAPIFLTEMINKELEPKIPVKNVLVIELKNKNTLIYYECPVYYIIQECVLIFSLLIIEWKLEKVILFNGF